MNGVPYISKQGDTLDLICREFYGNEQGGVVEFVLQNNVGLAELGPEIPQGTLIILPPAPSPAATDTVQLFS